LIQTLTGMRALLGNILQADEWLDAGFEAVDGSIADEPSKQERAANRRAVGEASVGPAA